MKCLRSVSVAVIALGSSLLCGEGAIVGPHSPQKELDSFKLLDGFEANLFAAEPMISNPIHITWDSKGRLWVACSSAYPHLKPGHQADDTIVILEDTDQDGQADKSTVFAKGLYIPTGIALGDGGVYAANQTKLLFLKDTDGDDRADVRRVMLSGFGMADSHHSISAWTWGPGGWLYFQEGTFMHTNIETPRGTVRSVNGGVFQYRPRRQEFHVYADYNASNPWGHDFDRWGQEILVDNPRFFFMGPLTANNRTKIEYRRSTRGPTKHSGGQFVSGRHLPRKFRGEFWTCRYKSHAIARYRPVPDGAGFSYSPKPPILKSDNRNFRPVDLEVGPRGAVYIVDWYDPLIGHMQHSLRDPRRDDSHGRIWRIRHKDRSLVDKPVLPDLSLHKLLDHLKAPEDWTRYQVKRLLYDAAPDKVAKELREWVESLDPNADGFEHHRLEALWSYQTIGVVNEALLGDVLRSEEPRARAAAVRVVRYWHDRINDPLDLVSEAVQDPDPRVRMEAVLSAGFVPHKKSLKVALRALDHPTDRYIRHALQRTVDGLQSRWLPAYRRGELEFEKAEHRQFALANVRSSEVVDALTSMLTSGSVRPSEVAGPARILASQVNAKQLEPLMRLLLQQTRGDAWGTQEMPYSSLGRVLQGLAEAAEQRGIKPDGARTLIARTAGIDAASVRIAWTRLVGAWQISREAGRLQRIVTSSGVPFKLRRAAAASLGKLSDDNVTFLLKLTRQNTRLANVLGVIGLAEADMDKGAERAAAVMSRPPGTAPLEALLESFLQRQGGTKVLAQALAPHKLNTKASRRALDYLNRIGEQDQALLEALRSVDSEAIPLAQVLRKQDIEELMGAIRTEGRPARGQRVFRRASLACTQCHGLAGAGPSLGPDLATIGPSAPLDYLIESLLQPNKVIKEGYQAVQIVTESGEVHSGILKGESKDRVRLLDRMRGGETMAIATSRIKQRERMPSLMPAGLVNRLTRQEFLDLVSYLQRLGRPGLYEPTDEPVIREWEVARIEPSSFEGELGEIADKLSWRSVYATVRGALPRWLYAPGQPKRPRPLLRADVGGAQTTKTRLKFNSMSGIDRIWVDHKERTIGSGSSVLLGTGNHSVTLSVDPKIRGKTPLRVIAERIASE